MKQIKKKQSEAEDKKKKSLERWAFAMKLLTNPYSIVGLLALGGGLYYYALSVTHAHGARSATTL